MRRGWFKESYRHYLAGKGISTKRYMATTAQKLAPRIGAEPTTKVNLKQIFGTPSGYIVESQQKIFDLQDERKRAKARRAGLEMENLRAQADLARSAEREDAPEAYVQRREEEMFADLSTRRRGIDKIELLENYKTDVVDALINYRADKKLRREMLLKEGPLGDADTAKEIADLDREIQTTNTILKKIDDPEFEFRTTNDPNNKILLTGGESVFVRALASKWLS